MAGSGTVQLRDDEDVLLRVKNLVVEHAAPGGGKVQAVTDVSFDVRRGETLGLVGESGCGKSTIGKALVADVVAAAGSVTLDGLEMTRLGRRELRAARARIQVIFQDPISSLNPRRRVLDVVNEGPAIWGQVDPSGETAREMLIAVGLDPDVVGRRRSRELSGGQCQRVAIARALMLGPELLICDEPVSALDVSIQAQILNLLEDLKAEHGLTMVFIAHDLSVVQNISDRVAVMYLGKLCELGSVQQLYEAPAHPYTRALIGSVPVPDPDAVLEPMVLRGDLPSPVDPPSGCRFRTRCPQATERCAAEEPVMRSLGDGHFVACHAVEPAR